jgi:lysozyme family protein
MATIGIPRRTLLGWGASLIALESAISRAVAHEPELVPELFGVKLPGEVSRLLPDEAIDAVGIVQTLIKLERAADSAKLPATPLRFDGDLSPTALAGSLYRSVMPRLVALIDRSKQIDPGLADQAGGLLARLHGAEHEIPALLRGFTPGSDQQLDWDADGPISFVPLSIDVAAGDIVAPPIVAGRRALWASAAPPAPKKPVPPPLSRARNYPALKDEYRRLFDSMTLRPSYSTSTDWYLTMLKTSRPSYDRVALDTGVPWYVIGIIHGLEASFNFLAHLHNGDHPLTGRTRKVPAGRPLTWAPPTDWDWSAKDALKLLGFTGKTDWNLERILFRFEAYNGFGYRYTAVPTPYLWSFSNHYESGKYVADGRFNAKAKSQQCGAAVMLKLLVDAGEINL